MPSASQQSLYDILGVAKEAEAEEIRKAYIKLAHKYHPDKTGGDKAAEEKLKEINAAYDTLKNPDKRRQYDAMLSGGFGFGGNAGAGGFDFSDFMDAFGGAGESPLNDIFNAFFGGGRTSSARSANRARQGRDAEAHVTITLREALEGVQKKVQVSLNDACGECNGSGAASGSSPQTCPDCGGRGQVRQVRGPLSISTPCPRCRGRGVYIAIPCRKCGGGGMVHAEREVLVEIPPGADTGNRLRLGGAGESGINGGPPGDLYVFIEIEEHDVFTREGDDVICEAPITFPQAALGAKVKVPSLTGSVELDIPPGTQSGTLMRMRGLGMPNIRTGRRGDQIAQVVVEVPTRVTPEQRELLEKLAEISGHDTYPRSESFMDKVRAFLGGD